MSPRLKPPGLYVTIVPAYQVMASMCGQPMNAKDAEYVGTRAGWYDKGRCSANAGHWYKVVEVGRRVKGVQSGDYVVADVHVRDHKIEFPGTKGMAHMHSKHLCGKLVKDGDRYAYKSLGYWSLVQRDAGAAAAAQGSTGMIHLTGESTTHGVLSGEDMETHEERDVQPGLRGVWARMLDPSESLDLDVEAGSVVLFQNIGYVSVPVSGQGLDAVADGAVLGVVEGDLRPVAEVKRLDKSGLVV